MLSDYSIQGAAMVNKSCLGNETPRGGLAPQVLPSALFPGAKCPFLAWKMSLRLHFLPKGHFWKLESMLFRENFFHFREKYDISGKFFVISGKIFEYLGKNVVYPENFFGMSGKFFWDELPPRRQHFREKIFRCLFYSKSAHQSLAPPNL
jgi:hypothetical protein